MEANVLTSLSGVIPLEVQHDVHFKLQFSHG
jgi:hypothetical protein